MKAALPAIFLIGCASTGTPELNFGISKTWQDGGFSTGSSEFFDEQPGGEQILNTSQTDFDLDDTFTLFAGVTIPLGPQKIQIVETPMAWSPTIPTTQSSPETSEPPLSNTEPSLTPSEPPNNNIKVLGMEIPTDTNPILVLAIAALVFVVGRFGYKRIQAKRGKSNGAERAKT